MKFQNNQVQKKKKTKKILGGSRKGDGEAASKESELKWLWLTQQELWEREDNGVFWRKMIFHLEFYTHRNYRSSAKAE